MNRLLSLLFVLVTIPTLAATHYVLSSATGAGTGADWNNAFTSLPTTLVRGDTYYIGSGGAIYPAYNFNTADSSTTLITILRATVADHGTSTGWLNSFDSQVTFAYSLMFSTDYWLVDGRTGSAFGLGTYGFVVAQPSNCNINPQHYVNFELVHDITIRYMAVRTCDATFNHEKYCFYNDNAGWSHLYNVTLTHCYGENMQALFFMVGVSNVITEYCYTTNAFSSESSPDGSGHHGEVWDFITVGTPNQNCTVRYCNAQNGVGTGTLIANDSGGDNLAILGIAIYGNIFQNGSGGNGVIGCTTHSGMANAQVYNNTFYNNTTTWLVEAQAASSATVVGYTTNNVATNNLVFNQNASIGNFGATPWFNDYNYYVNCTSVPAEAHGSSASTNVFLNPGVDFHLANQTPQGLLLPGPYNTDPDGVTRAFPSRGAYEYVGGAPFITVQPQPVSILVGANATFSVVSSGTVPLTYQWKLNGANIASATTSSFTTNAVVIGANGTAYSVGVTNSFGGVLSTSATLTVSSGGNNALTNIYVSPSGSITNTGASTNSPWPFDYALSHSGPSNTIYVMQGIYPNETFTVTNSWQTIQSYPSKWLAILSNAPTQGLLIPHGVNGVTVNGLVIDRSQWNGIQIGDNDGTGNFWGGSNNIIENCWIKHVNNNAGISGGSGNGIAILPSTNCLVDSCLSEINGGFQSFDHGIYFSGFKTIIRNNVCRYNATSGIKAENDATDNIDRCQVYNNLVYSNVRLGGANNADIGLFFVSLAKTNFYFGNTVIGTNTYAVNLSMAGAGLMQWTNNIISAKTAPFITTSGVNEDYNLVSQSVGGPHDVVGTSAFVNTNIGLYWLASGSSARGIALSTVFGAVNWFGQAQASVIDGGAIQFAAGLTTDARVLDPSPSVGADYWTNISSAGGVAPTISTQPVGTNIQVSQSFTLSVVPAGTPPFNYQWKNGTTVVQNGTVQNYTKANAQTNDSGTYTVVITNVFGTVTSSSVTVNVTNPVVPQALIAISPGALNYGLQVTNVPILLSFNVQNVGAANLSYTSSVGVGPYSIVSGGTNTTLIPGGIQTVTVQYLPTAPSFLTPDTNTITITNITSGGQTNLSLTGIAYTLQNPTNINLTAATILYGFVSSETGTVYQPFTGTSPLATNEGVLYAGFTLPNLWTNAVLYGFAETTNIANNSYWANIDQFPTDPQNIWDMTNLNSGGLQFYPMTWRPAGITNYVNQGGLTNVFNLSAGPHVIEIAGREGFCVLSTLEVLQQSQTYPVPPNIVTQPVSPQYIPSGGPMTPFSVTAVGTSPLAYQWYFNSIPIAGANQTAYALVYPLPSNSGLYSCLVTNSVGSLMSFAATLVVTDAVPGHVKVHFHH